MTDEGDATAGTEFDVERYLNVRSAYGASIGPDGRVAFLHDATGVPQVWTLDEPASWPDQRTFADERVTFVEWSPERSEFVYGMDEGGNERVQLYLLDPDGGAPVDLTRRPEAKHRWGGWHPDGGRFAFAANRRDEAAFDVYVQARDEQGAAARRVHETDGWFSVAGWRPDGDRLAVVESTSSFDQDVYVLDPATGDREHLTPHEGDVRYGGVEWGPDGEHLYVVTDRETDTLRLERIAVADGTHATVVDGGEHEVDGVSVDQESGRLVYSRNVDGYTELTVGRLTAPDEVSESPGPTLPDGVAGGVAWSADGERSSARHRVGPTTPTSTSSTRRRVERRGGPALRPPESPARRSSSRSS